jgi:phospholipid/cholesterol/gamma-HCH transport system ATP-binding protein
LDLRAEKLGVTLGGRPVLASLDLKLPQGSRTLVVGPQGSGKTTLLKALASLRPPTTGRVLWGDALVAKLSPRALAERRRAFGMIFQTDALFDTMTVAQNVAFPLARRGAPADEVDARVGALLAEVGLSHARDLKPDQLSGGMRKRAGIARALAARPEVLLADDPFAGLDPETAAEVAKTLDTVTAGKTLVVTGHAPPPGLTFDRTLTLGASP